MNIIYLGIDLAKNVFQLCGLNQAGKPVYKKRTDRKTLLQTVANIPACLIGVEASTDAFYWQCEFEKLGHRVKVVSPQYVKPFVRGQKNDSNDAQAIAIALMQPTMQFIPQKALNSRIFRLCTVQDSVLLITALRQSVKSGDCCLIGE
ncbi:MULTISPECIES: IS110 family transposase [Enterobacterales]|uniref:IS110 family transposase n=1 Tax=Enterobacterales TaxID=91347 RepID=UPI0002FDDF47|nr:MULTISPECIES: IS110 family transposase [Enterobacterales]SSJ78060.1 transposase, IS110 family [Klebsiella pneumoniae]AND11868.1 hypothetical protein AOUC001_02885 [Proteus mirabilis]ATC74784.1 hypothetical protein BG257_09185 [Proteus mirabilis]ATC80049.1 hypothetical protein BG029_17045 [Proteus mirabilis]MCB4817839.1 IS110 family transposase [Proteus mirabilis]